MYVLFLYIILPLRQVFSIHALFLEYLTTRLALTSVLGPFGNSFYPPRCIDALFGVRIPFQSQVQRAIQIPVRQSRVPFMFTQVTERPWEIETQDLPIFIL